MSRLISEGSIRKHFTKEAKRLGFDAIKLNKRGWTDWLLIGVGIVAFVELKKSDGVLSDAQLIVGQKIKGKKHIYMVCYSKLHVDALLGYMLTMQGSIFEEG